MEWSNIKGNKQNINETLKVKERESKFELMRIFSMLLIVLGHVFSWSGVTKNATPNLKNYIYIIYTVLIVHVNSFILVSGFFQSESKKIKFKKIFKLLFLVWFYNIAISIIGVKLGWFELNKNEIIDLIIPFRYKSHWFIYIYVFLYCVSSYINEITNKISQKDYKKLLLILLIFCSIMPTFFKDNFDYFNRGFSIINFVFVYLIGSYIKKYYDTIKFNKMFYLIIIMIVCMILNYVFFKTELFDYNTFLSYNNPFSIISSVSYFLIFSLLKFKNKPINYISKHIIEVYIISEMPRLRNVLYNMFGLNLTTYDSRRIIPYCFIVSIIILLGCVIIAYIRDFIFRNVIELYNKSKIHFKKQNN